MAILCSMKKRNIILIHALYWFYIINQFLFPVYIGQHKDPAIMEAHYINDVIISLMLNVLTFYAVYFAFYRIISFRNKGVAALSLLLLIVSIMGVRLPVDRFFWNAVAYLPEKEMAFEWVWVWNHLRLTVITAIYAVLIRYLIDAFEAQKLRAELITRRQASELALLRSQVNPHFLFNTLNNIYSLVYQQSEEAPEAVMKFSSIMRYVLYDAAADSIPLEKEIDYLKSYIELQKLRYRQPGLVQMTIEGEPGGIAIAPMVLIPFVEDAFRHTSKNHQPAIIITLVAAEQAVTLEISGHLRKGQQVIAEEGAEPTMANIRRRLDLLYPGKHQLTVTEEEGRYKVCLILES